MLKYVLGLCLFVCANSFAHQMTPAYPTLKPGPIDKIYQTTVEITNLRQDVEYFEIGVFDKNWKPVTFVTPSQILRIPFLNKKTINIYVTAKDAYRITYICSVSKTLKQAKSASIVRSRICSKVK